MSLKKLLLVTFSVLLFQQAFSQRNYEGYNKLGITGGLSLFDINTSDLNTKQGSGFIAGFTTRGAFRNDFDLIYGISFISSKVGILGSSTEGGTGGSDELYIDYTIPGAQLNFLGSYNIIKHHLSLEFGPILTINGKMKLDSDRYKDYLIDGYSTIHADDIQDISKINFHAMGGLTAGIEGFRLSAQYQYGVTNMLHKLSDSSAEKSKFKGHSSTIILVLIIYF